MSKETSTRFATGILGGLVLLLLITVGGHIGISFVTAVLSGLMCWELSNVFYEMSDRNEKTKALIGLSWLTIFVNMFFPRAMLECLVVSFMGLFTYYLAVADRHAENLKRHFDEFAFTVFALIYVVVFVAFLPLIRDGSNGVRWLLLFLFIVWSGDTGAYFVGRKWGRRKLYPLISPGKSLEGAIGGLASSVGITILFKLVAFSGLGWFSGIMTAVFVGVVSQIGDLCESFFKRAYRIKDSSKILPGHGGILDRFDGIIFSLPIMYFCVKVFS